MIIKLRPHHLLCLSRFNDNGWYDKTFEKNFKKIFYKIKKNPDYPIIIIKGCDDICGFCPYCKGNKCKKTFNLNRLVIAQDNNVLRRLFLLKNNRTIVAKDIFRLVSLNIKNKDLKKWCKKCEYLRYCLKLKKISFY